MGETREVRLWDRSVNLRGAGADLGGTEVSKLRIRMRYSAEITGIRFSDCETALSTTGALGFPVVLNVRDCAFIGNVSVSGTGGAISGEVGDVTAVIERCLFENNEAEGGGGAIWWTNNVYLHDCQFIGNTAPQGGVVSADRLEASGCLFWKNQGTWGAALDVGRAEVENCTFWENEGESTIWILGTFEDEFRNCIIGRTIGGYGIQCGGAVRVTCCNLSFNDEGNDGYCFPVDTDIDVDPMLCDPDEGDFTLDVSSPCAPGTVGNGECGLIGAFDVGCGASPTIERSWGRIKTLFR